MTIKAVLFDMDGVLVDVSRSYRRAIEETATHFTGRDISAGTVQRYKNLGGFNDDWKLTHALIHDTGIQVPMSRVIAEFQRRYRGDNWDGFIAEEPALVESTTLDRLASGRIFGVVTGRPEAEARWTLQRFGWDARFPLVVAREQQDGRSKPDPFPLQRALSLLNAAGLNVQPHEAVYVGDTVDDMEAARAAGLWAIGHVPPYLEAEAHMGLLRARGAHAVVATMDELPGALASLADLAEAAVPDTAG